MCMGVVEHKKNKHDSAFQTDIHDVDIKRSVRKFEDAKCVIKSRKS